MIKSRRFLGRLLGPLLKTDLLLMKDVLALLAINALIPLVLTAPSAADGSIDKEFLDWGQQY